MKNLSKICHFFIAFITLALTTSAAQADEKTFTTFDNYQVLHTVFNSTFIKPEIASAYNLTRGKDHALINIALVKTDDVGQSYGLPAKVTGTVANLMQQQKPLEFIEIKEQNAVYYLADLRFQNEEVLHFTINVNANGKDHEVTFTKKLYAE